MKGQILFIDNDSGEGIITSSDGRRFNFSDVDLRGSGEIARPGVAVDFEAEGDTAREIYPDPSPVSARQEGEKNKVVAALLAFFLGGFGAHKFYIGANGAGIVMLLCTLLGWVLAFIPTGIIWTISIIEAAIYLTRSDDDFYRNYEVGKKSWF